MSPLAQLASGASETESFATQGSRPGDRLLDLGAGTGLVALGARKRLTEEGSVVACDLSLGALLECRRRADEEDPAGGRLHLMGGDALALPFRADV
jgi:ubiquinone/menaquinone biosynthesis C-methylase UbiE